MRRLVLGSRAAETSSEVVGPTAECSAIRAGLSGAINGEAAQRLQSRVDVVVRMVVDAIVQSFAVVVVTNLPEVRTRYTPPPTEQVIEPRPLINDHPHPALTPPPLDLDPKRRRAVEARGFLVEPKREEKRARGNERALGEEELGCCAARRC